MKTLFAALGLLVCVAGPARADACSELVNIAETALKMKGLDQDMVRDLENLVKQGRQGDIQQCQQSRNTLFQSSPEGEKARKVQRCEDSINSV